MKEQLLASKLRMPQVVCSAIRRPGLLERIHESPRQVLALHAGAGYGKTAIMADYFQTYRLPCGWYQLGRTDDDMDRFLRYFEALLQRQAGRFRVHKETVIWTRETVELTVVQILEQLESVKEDVNIVLDDFQFIQNPLIFEFLSLFIRYMGDGIRLFFLIRGKFPEFLSCYLLRGMAGVLGTQDLKITEPELKAYLQESRRKWKKADAEQILSGTEGWAIAVNYVLDHLEEADGAGMADLLSGFGLSDYLCYEILNPLSTKQRIFMAESAALARLTPEACDHILETEDSGAILDSFADRQLLTERAGTEEYRYHPMLQRVLCRQLREGRKQEIWKRAAQYFGALQEKQQAVHYYGMLEPKQHAGAGTAVGEKESDGPLQLSCFGELRIHIGDEKNIVHWRTRKTKEMFAYLWEQERPAGKEKIMDALWQEGNEQGREALFHTTLSYLKRAFSAIGISDLIRTDNKRYTMNRQHFHSDTQSLKQLYERWKGAKELDVEREFRELNRLYRGEYMEELDGSWALSGREYYQGIYLQCCELLANQAAGLQKYDQGIRVLERALKLDPYSDQLNGMLLENLCAMGEFQAARQQYERYNRLLREELNIGIGRQVQEIYQNTIVRRTG
ncbi:MAG: hypothetical protein K2N94_09345 [Lachnospiraceae bacterium]|nr:hypothetical protein [Lachnospiraceae bacterium]